MIHNFPEDSKIWIFQNNKKFTFNEECFIKSELLTFLDSWNAHGKNLITFSEIKHNQFILVVVNQQIEKASGCSIDSLVKQIKNIETALNLNLLDRNLVAYFLETNKEEILISSLVDFKKKIKDKEIKAKDFIFNNSVSTISEYNNSWIEPIEASWAKIYL